MLKKIIYILTFCFVIFALFNASKASAQTDISIPNSDVNIQAHPEVVNEKAAKKQKKEKKKASKKAKTDSATLVQNASVADSVLMPTDSINALMQQKIAAGDSIKTDTLKKKKQLIDEPVLKEARDSINYSLDRKKIYMYGDAKITYGEREIQADYIEFDNESKTIYATGIPDSTGQRTKVKFKDGNETYEIEDLKYNFNTKQALIKNVATHQGEGIMYSKLSKMHPDKSVHIKGAQYTTCDAEHPHFYFQMTKAKVIPSQHGKNGQVIFGPMYLVVEDVPMPIALPFGFFPLTTGASSGFLMPSYGEETNRGFYLQGLGYYFLLGDYGDLSLTADIYHRGSWGFHAAGRYIKRYKFSGQLGFDYSKIKLGDKGTPDYSEQSAYNIKWSHTKAPQANPSTTFSASVNISSAKYNLYNENTVQNMLTAATSSSISFSKTWEGSPFSMTAAMTQSQNMTDSTWTVGFPSISFSMTKIYPFKRKNRVGKVKFYENIGISYNMTFNNAVTNFKEDSFGKKEFWDKMSNSMVHNFSLTLPTFTLLKYITASPSISYKPGTYFQKTTKEWDPIGDTIAYNHSDAYSKLGFTHEYSGGISLTTHIYGLFDKFKPKSKIRAIRHVITPQLSFSYTPNMHTAVNGWRKVYNRRTRKYEEYNIYNENIHNSGNAPSGYASGSINFSMGNTLEMKVRSDKDTSNNGEKKIKLLESFNISTSYNLLADSLNMSDITFSGRTTLFEKVGINFGFSLNPYQIDNQGRIINKYYFAKNFTLGRLTRFNASTDYTFSSGNKGKGTSGEVSNMSNMLNNSGGILADQTTHNDLGATHNALLDNFEPYYVNFNVPWSLSLGLTYNYTKNYSYNETTRKLRTINTHTTTLDIRGDLNLTENWKVSFTSGVDFKAGKLSTSSISIHRDLHCLEFSFTWVPFGTRQSWGFTIRAKSSMLRDALKYDKHSSSYDNYTY